MGVLATKTGSWEHQKVTVNRGNQTCQVKGRRAFLCMGRCKSPGSLKPFLGRAPRLPGASVLCFLTLSLLRGHLWAGCSG